MKKNIAWSYLIIGGLLEIVWATGFKYDQIPDMVVLLSILLSFDLLIRASKEISIGIAYSVFTAMGTVGTVMTDTLLSGSPLNPLKVALVAFLLLCVIGLKMSEQGSEA
jgi:multidrug transporter EmrE-like cation transporter